MTQPSAPRAAAPWWLTWALAASLASLLVGARLEAGLARTVLVACGLAGGAGATGWRLVSFLGAAGDARKLEGWLAAANAGVVAALACRWIGGDALGPLWPIVLAVAVLPALAGQLPITAARHAGPAARGLVAKRVVQSMSSGLTVALALAALIVGGYITAERDRTWDVSYFRTSSPSAATANLVASLGEPLRVILFFPEVNDVKDELLGYFRQLEGQLVVETRDPLDRPDLARANRVTETGTVVLVRGSQRVPIIVGTDLEAARPRLRTFDAEVQDGVRKASQPARVAYLVTGHGELGEPDAAGRTIEVLRKLLDELELDTRSLPAAKLAQDIPADARLVMVLGPRRALAPEDLAALDRYVARGGALLMALDPDGEASLGALEPRLGVRFVRSSLVDDVVHASVRGDRSDRRYIITDKIAAHVSVGSVAKGDVARTGLLFLDAGSFEPVSAEPTRHARIDVVQSLPSTFADLDGDFEQGPMETRKQHVIASTFENWERTEGAPGPGTRTMAVMLFADADTFTDAVLSKSGLNALLVHGALEWLAQVEPENDELRPTMDVAVNHGNRSDAPWFYSTIVGAPLAILGIGALAVRSRRRRPATRARKAAQPGDAAVPAGTPLARAMPRARLWSKASAIHAVVLAVALVLAYRDWAADAAMPAGGGTIPVWNEDPGRVAVIRYTTDGHSVELRRRADETGAYFWADTQTVKKDRPEDRMLVGSAPPDPSGPHAYLAGASGERLVQSLARLRATRDLGVLAPAEKQRFGLAEPVGTLEIGPRKLQVGIKVPGAWYVLDPGTGRGYALDAKLLAALDDDELLMEHRLHADDGVEIRKAEVQTPAGRLSLVRRLDVEEGGWARARRPDYIDRTLSGALDFLEVLAVDAYATPEAIAGLSPAVRIDYLGRGDRRVRFVELYAKPRAAAGPGEGAVEYFVKTERSRVPARVSTTYEQGLAGHLAELAKASAGAP